MRPRSHRPTMDGAAVVVEATYGVSNHLPREGREQRLLSRVRAILKGGGRCLLPVVALGRAQVPIPAPPALYPHCQPCMSICAASPDISLSQQGRSAGRVHLDLSKMCVCRSCS